MSLYDLRHGAARRQARWLELLTNAGLSADEARRIAFGEEA